MVYAGCGDDGVSYYCGDGVSYYCEDDGWWQWRMGDGGERMSRVVCAPCSWMGEVLDRRGHRDDEAVTRGAVVDTLPGDDAQEADDGNVDACRRRRRLHVVNEAGSHTEEAEECDARSNDHSMDLLPGSDAMVVLEDGHDDSMAAAVEHQRKQGDTGHTDGQKHASDNHSNIHLEEEEEEAQRTIERQPCHDSFCAIPLLHPLKSSPWPPPLARTGRGSPEPNSFASRPFC